MSIGSVAAIEQELLAVKAEWNERTLPGRLPPEILLRIFKYCRDEWLTHAYMLQHAQRRSQDYSESSSYGSYDLWLQITHVCAHWRRIALSDPSLWTQLRPHTLERTEAFLQRSQQMPLSVILSMDAQDDGMAEIMGLILRHASRIHRLRVRYIGTSYTNRAWDVHHFPQLRCLSLYHERDPPFIQPKNAFPLLEDLRLNNYGVANALSIISTQSACLTRLHLNNCVSRVVRSGWSRFLEVMAEIAPRLQDLVLAGALPAERHPMFPIDADLPSIVPTIRMPHLHSLTIRDSAVGTAVVLHHLSFPSSASIMLTCQTSLTSRKQSTSPYVIKLLGALERALTVNVLGPPPISDSVSVTLLGRSDTTLHTVGPLNGHGYHTTTNNSTYPPHAKVMLRLRCYDKLTGVIEPAVTFAPWRDTERLYIDREFERAYHYDAPYMLGEESWKKLFDALPRLRELSVPDRGEASLLGALIPRQDQVVSCPALDVLRLRSVSFKDDPPATILESEAMTNQPFRPYHLTKEQWVRDMCAIIRKRRALELGPSELIIHHHLEDPAPLHQLAQHGVRVQLVSESHEINQCDQPGKVSLSTDGVRDGDDSEGEFYYEED